GILGQAAHQRLARRAPALQLPFAALDLTPGYAHRHAAAARAAPLDVRGEDRLAGRDRMLLSVVPPRRPLPGPALGIFGPAQLGLLALEEQPRPRRHGGRPQQGEQLVLVGAYQRPQFFRQPPERDTDRETAVFDLHRGAERVQTG